MFEYKKEILGDHVVISFYGDIDIDSVEIVEEKIMPDIVKGKSIELNLSNVSFVDSTGIGLLIKFANHYNTLESTVTITNIRFEVLEVLKLLQIPDILGHEVFPQLID